MKFDTWQQITQLKTNLLGAVSILLEDKEVSREHVASFLVEQIESLNYLEEQCIKQMQNTSIPELINHCEEINKQIKNRLAIAGDGFIKAI